MRNIYFDVDATLISVQGLHLRPHAREVIARLRAHGLRVYLWSAMGDWYAKNAAIKHGLECDGFFSKPADRDDWTLEPHLPEPHFAFDDCEERFIETFDGLIVRPYYDPDPDDDELLRVLDWIEVHPSVRELIVASDADAHQPRSLPP